MADIKRLIQREAGKYDGIEQFNFYSPEFDDHKKVPPCIRPFMNEITAFCNVSKIILCMFKGVLIIS